MIVLALDASTYVASLALFDGDRLVAADRAEMRGADEERLLPAVGTLLAQAALRPADLGRIVCGAGPGSFTSLRIAASIAKGLASGGGVPLHAVSSLALVVAGSDGTLAPGRYVAALDALRGEHYVAISEVGPVGEVMSVGATERWPTGALRERAAAIGPLVGPGLAIDATPDVAGLRRMPALLTSGSAVDLHAWEPDYGRMAEAQVKWEAAHGRPLPAA